MKEWEIGLEQKYLRWNLMKWGVVMSGKRKEKKIMNEKETHTKKKKGTTLEIRERENTLVYFILKTFQNYIYLIYLSRIYLFKGYSPD